MDQIAVAQTVLLLEELAWKVDAAMSTIDNAIGTDVTSSTKPRLESLRRGLYVVKADAGRMATSLRKLKIEP